MSGRIMKSGLETSTFSCSEPPARIFSTLVGSQCLLTRVGLLITIVFSREGMRGYKA